MSVTLIADKSDTGNGAHVLIRRLERIAFYRRADGYYSRLPRDVRELRRVGPAQPEDAPFTDVLEMRIDGAPVHFLAEVVGAPGSESDMSTADAAGLLSMDERTVRRWAKDGRIAATQSAGGSCRRGSWRVSTASVQSLMNERQALDPGPAPSPPRPRKRADKSGYQAALKPWPGRDS